MMISPKINTPRSNFFLSQQKIMHVLWDILFLIEETELFDMNQAFKMISIGVVAYLNADPLDIKGGRQGKQRWCIFIVVFGP